MSAFIKKHPFGLGLAVGLGAMAILLTVVRQSPSPARTTPAVPLTIINPPEIVAGEGLTVRAGPMSAPDGDLAHLLAMQSFGPRQYTTTVVDGYATFVLTGEDTRRSGHVSLTVLAGGQAGQSQVTIRPGSPTSPVTPLVGARSIVADGHDWAMAVVIPTDVNGNPVATGTPVRVRALHPGNRLETDVVATRNLLAWTRIRSGTRAGKTLLAADVAGQHGPEATLLQVPGWPVPFTIEADVDGLSADGRQLTNLRTSQLVDQFGNVVPDGTSVTFVVEAPSRALRTIPATTIDGVAQAPLQAPEAPGTLLVLATVYGVESEPLALAFRAGPVVGTIRLTSRLDPAVDTLILTAGPLLGALAQYVPDGTLVQFHMNGPTGEMKHYSAVAEGGFATLVLRPSTLLPGIYNVQTVSGTAEGAITLSIGEEPGG